MADNFGFNINSGLGELFKAPNVNPVASRQFAPVQPIRRKEKDSKDAITGAILGAIAPALAEGGVDLLGKLPGLEKVLFQKDPKAAEELGITRPDVGEDADVLKNVRKRSLEGLFNEGRPLTDDQYEVFEDSGLLRDLRIGTEVGIDPVAAENYKRKQLVDKLLPEGKLPRQKTFLGKALTEGLTYLPALAADEGVSEFITTASGTKKVQGALEDTKLKNYLTNVRERGKALIDIKDFERKTSHSALLQEDGTFQPIQREVLISPDKNTRYVISQGNPKVDFVLDELGKRHTVPAGKKFIREDLSLSDTEPGKPNDVKLLATAGPNKGLIGFGYVQYSTGPEGRKSRIVFRDPLNRDGDDEEKTKAYLDKKYGDNWVPYDQELADLMNAVSETKTDPRLTSMYEGRRDKEIALLTVANVASELLPITIAGEKDASLLTGVGKGASMLTKLNEEVKGLYSIFERTGRSVGNIVYEQAANPQTAISMNNLLLASNAYSAAMSQGTAQQKADATDNLINALQLVQKNAKAEGQIDDFTAMDLGADKFREILLAQGKLQAGQLRLAYAAAAADGQTGTSLSDADITNYLAQLGFGLNDAQSIGLKISGFVKNSFQTFDGGEFRLYANTSRSHDPLIDIAVQDDLIAGAFLNESTDDLKALRDPEKTQAEKEEAASRIRKRIASKAPNAVGDFFYDRENQRFRYITILERLGKLAESDHIGYKLLYDRYFGKPNAKGVRTGGLFQHYGITEDEINLVSDPESVGVEGRMIEQKPRYRLRIRQPIQ